MLCIFKHVCDTIVNLEIEANIYKQTDDRCSTYTLIIDGFMPNTIFAFTVYNYNSQIAEMAKLHMTSQCFIYGYAIIACCMRVCT